MSRYLKHVCSSQSALKQNAAHQFAQLHALNIYPSDAIYTLIPKNACSTLRLSIAMANGCIKDPEDVHWIHKNNQTFSADLRDLAKAKYTFVILRDPFARLLSAYLDKIVDRRPETWIFLDLADKRNDIELLSFEFFVNSLQQAKIRNGNHHWRAQSHFLVYDQYDDYFSLENFEHVVTTLREKINFEVVDARSLTQHQTSGFKSIELPEAYRKNADEILLLKKAGQLPRAEDMFNPELIRLVADLYKEDIELYFNKVPNAEQSLCQRLLASIETL